jgi:2-polyprenyl-6-methoxyphenol hydroxylase-like FAD-dependent oxidoreductase
VPELRELGAGRFLTLNACAVLGRLGPLDALGRRALRTPAWYILDIGGHTLQELRPFPRGGMALSTRRSDPQQALVAALPDGLLHLGRAADLVELRPDGVQVRFADSSTLNASLVIAADGAASRLRQQLWPGRRLCDQGYVGWRAVVDGGPGHWADGRITESWGLGQRFGIAAAGGGRTYWYASANASLAAADDPADLEHHLYPQVPHHRWPELARRLDAYFAGCGVQPIVLWR